MTRDMLSLMRPHKPTNGDGRKKQQQDHKRPYKAIQANTTIPYHNMPQKITLCSHWASVNFILTYTVGKFSVSFAQFLLPCTFFVRFETKFAHEAKNNKNNDNNNKDSIRTIEHCSRSKSSYVSDFLLWMRSIKVLNFFFFFRF